MKSATKLIEILNKNNFDAYIIGGCVRDYILGIEPHDIDICTNAEPNTIVSILEDNNIHYTTVGIKYGTVVAHMNGEEYEITTFRSDGQYSDNRKPDSVQFEADLINDVLRRDFTINAIAYNPVTEEITDYTDGCVDIRNKILRCIGDPNKRFKEDALRILRALRFSIKFGFKIEDKTSDAIHANKNLLNNISKERITNEIEKILTCGKPIHSIFIEYSDVIGVIIPEIVPCINFKQNNKYHKHDVYEHMLYVTDLCKTIDFDIKMAALLHDIGKPNAYSVDEQGYGHFYGHPEICAEIASEVLKNRFRLTSKQYNEIVTLIKYHDLEVSDTDKSVRRALVKLGKETLQKWFILKQADIDDHIHLKDKEWFVDIDKLRDRAKAINDKENCFKISDLQINGKDIMRITGLKPGKRIGEILNQLFNEVINGDLNNTNTELSKRVAELM